MIDDEFEARLFRPDARRRTPAGRVFRACEETLHGEFPEHVVEGWWVGRRDDGEHDQRVAAAIAWETLAARGIIPAAWVEEDTRGFVRDPADDVACPVCERRDGYNVRDCCNALHVRVVPWTLDDCLTFAVDVRGLGSVEAMVRQWRPEATERVVWRSLDAHAIVKERLRVARQWDTLAMEARAVLEMGYGVEEDDDGALRLIAARL